MTIKTEFTRAMICVAMALPTVALAENPNIVRSAKGEYSYIKQETGEIVGHEEWSMTVDRSGMRTFNIMQEWDERDYVSVTVHRLNADLRPIETFQTRWDSGGWLSSGVYTVAENTVTAVATGRTGRTTQTLEVPENFSMVPHPLATDGLHFWYVDSPEGKTVDGTVYNIRVMDEVTGAAVGAVDEVKLTHLGEASVTTDAGTFDTQHFKMGDTSDFWIKARDGILVRLTYGPTGVRYDLTFYEEKN